jgi:hypothetical protein
MALDRRRVAMWMLNLAEEQGTTRRKTEESRSHMSSTGLAAAVLKIAPRRKIPVRRVSVGLGGGV